MSNITPDDVAKAMVDRLTNDDSILITKTDFMNACSESISEIDASYRDADIPSEIAFLLMLEKMQLTAKIIHKLFKKGNDDAESGN